MAKRLTDTNKYKKPFIRGLLGPYKLLWDYLYHDCDHAGIWIVDFEVAQVYLGQDMKVNKEDALTYFNQDEIRIVEIDVNRWFIAPFIEFQYGVLNEQNRAHKSVIQLLKKYNLWDGASKGLVRPLLGCKVKDKDKDKEKKKEEFEKEKEKQNPDPETEKLYNQVVEFFPEDLRPKTEKQRAEWLDTLDKLIRIDGYESETISRVIEFARKDDFWKINFLSLLKLRQKDRAKVSYFLVFQSKMKNEYNSKQSGKREVKRINAEWGRED